MPALVLAYAVDLRRRGRGWRAIVEELQRSGNGRYDVRTLTRRIVQVLAGQNSAELAAAAAAVDVAGGAVKTGRGLAGAARPGRGLQRRSKLRAARPGVCRKCGCTEDHACMTTQIGGACFWVEVDLCSACAPGLARRLLDQPHTEA